MTFLLDHDVPEPVAEVLEHWGHQSLRLRSVLPIDSTDQAVFEFAQSQELPILSCNRDHFLGLAKAALQAAPASSFAGLIILIRRRSRQSECAHLLQLLRKAGSAGISNNINFA